MGVLLLTLVMTRPQLTLKNQMILTKWQRRREISWGKNVKKHVRHVTKRKEKKNLKLSLKP